MQLFVFVNISLYVLLATLSGSNGMPSGICQGDFVNSDIDFLEIKENTKTYLNFTTNTSGLLDCYINVKVGKSMVEFLNHFDISEILPPSCNEKKAMVFLMSDNPVKKIKEYVKHPFLQSPSKDIGLKVIFSKKDLTIDLIPSPRVPLNCLKAKVMVTKIQPNPSGKLNSSSYFYLCKEQQLN